MQWPRTKHQGCRARQARLTKPSGQGSSVRLQLGKRPKAPPERWPDNKLYQDLVA